MKTLRLLLNVVLVYALAVGICCAAEHESGRKGQIVFQSDRDGNVEVFRINADGSNTVQITHTEPGDENEPIGNYCPSVYERHSGQVWREDAGLDDGC